MKRRQRNQLLVVLIGFGIFCGALEVFAFWLLINEVCS